jgi:hypothetical protein
MVTLMDADDVRCLGQIPALASAEQEAQEAYQKAVGPDGNGRTANIINEIFQKMPGYKSQHPAVMMAVLAVAELWEIDPARARKIERGLTTLANLNRV